MGLLQILAEIFGMGERKEVSVSHTEKFSWPDASQDKCLECGVTRIKHGNEHKFQEQEN